MDVHHDTLLEFSADIGERLDFIKAHKPKKEQKLRLRLLKEVQGELPVAVIGAGAAYNEAWVAYNEAWAVRDKAVADNLPAIEALHAQECPGCPWDGETIFPGKGD